MPIAILMCGIPGGGKTFVRDILLDHLPFHPTVLAPDDIVEDVAERLGMTYRSVYDNQHLKDYCYNRNWDEIVEAARSKNHLLIDRTHIDAAYRTKTMNFVRDVDPSYEFFCMDVRPPDVFTWVKRLDQREGKEIPADILFRFVRTYQSPSYLEGFRGIWSGRSDDLRGLDLQSAFRSQLSLIEEFHSLTTV